MFVALTSILAVNGCDKDSTSTKIVPLPEHYVIKGMNAGQDDTFHVVIINGGRYLYRHDRYGSCLCPMIDQRTK